MASCFHEPVAADVVKDKAAFFFGLPGGKTLSAKEEEIELSYESLKMPGIYRLIDENTEGEVPDKLAEAQAALGDTLAFQGKEYAVCQAVTWLKGKSCEVKLGSSGIIGRIKKEECWEDINPSLELYMGEYMGMVFDLLN